MDAKVYSTDSAVGRACNDGLDFRSDDWHSRVSFSARLEATVDCSSAPSCDFVFLHTGWLSYYWRPYFGTNWPSLGCQRREQSGSPALLFARNWLTSCANAGFGFGFGLGLGF